MAKNPKTAKPTGLKITRNGKTFTLSWKKGDKDYNDGQSVQYRTSYSPKTWKKLSVGKNDTSKSLKIDNAYLYPYKNAKGKGYPLCSWVEMRVCGNRAKYTKKHKTINPTVSAWSTIRYTIQHPKLPTVSAALSDTLSNVCTFSWSTVASTTDAFWLSNIEWQSILVKNSNVTDGSKLTWNSSALGWQTGVGTASSSKVITEDTETLSKGAYTRWFRVRSRGPAGVSINNKRAAIWAYAKHVYGMSYQALISSATAFVSAAGGFQCKVVWDAPSSASHPIDKTTVEYCITVPDVGMTCPDGASWTVANVSADTGANDGVTFPIDRLLSEDQCLFIRVNTEHDNVITYGTPVLVDGGVGALKKPTITTVEGSDYRVAVTISNTSDIVDSFTVILYRPASDPTTENIIGVLEHGETSGTFQAPDWSGETAHAFGAYSAVGDVETISHDNALMKSEIVWGVGDVPKAPPKPLLSSTSISGTIRVEWEWEWNEADGAEISWSEHDDAWESTDQPDVYEIQNIHNGRWNISGLETGIKWYVRVRLCKNSGDTKVYGGYSEIAEIDLASAPSIPTLVLSDEVITEDGSVTASWAYTTSDGTSQGYAEICECTDTANGRQYGSYKLSNDTKAVSYEADASEVINKKPYYTRSGAGTYDEPYAYTKVAESSFYNLTEDVEVDETKTYYTRSGSGTTESPYVFTKVENPVTAELSTYYEANANPHENNWYEYFASIAHTETEQHITINAKDVGWETGRTYNLCVRVVSASGKVSDEWSAPVPISIAEPLTISINNTSLVEETETITIDGETFTRTFLSLKEMPFTFDLSEDEATVVIERNGAYHMERPDETDFDGYDQETIVIKKGDVSEINVQDLNGSLDDGASYRMIATVSDDLGQSAEASVEFEVHWSHQAITPDGTVVIDETEMIAEITPTADDDYMHYYALTTDEVIVESKTYYTRSGAGTEESPYVYTEVETPDVSEISTYYERLSYGDVCDIYRLSVDRPELIVRGGAFGTTYVDPFVTIGQFGGYRIVFRTANNDYITEDNEIAWANLIEDTLETDYTVIDFDGGRILLEYNVDVSNTWDKDFQETKYLGGSVQGDWNKAVSRTSSVSAVSLTITDEETIEMIRRLAISPSICHVRTKDGSSYSADVQVSESYSHDKYGKIVSYTFTITRVDTEKLDGMTLTEWNELHDEEE